MQEKKRERERKNIAERKGHSSGRVIDEDCGASLTIERLSRFVGFRAK